MKKISGLQKQIQGIGGLPIHVPGIGEGPLKVKDAVTLCVMQAQFKTGKEDFKAKKVMTKIDETTENELLVEDAEYETLQQAVEQNKPGFSAQDATKAASAIGAFTPAGRAGTRAP